MRLGVSIAQVGRLADPCVIRSAATAAEGVGYSSIWVLDRLLTPLAPRDSAPEEIADTVGAGAGTALDPLGVLAYAAAVTTRVRLGTSVLVAPWYRPMALARSLTTLDVLSDGRLTVGLGLGWSLDELDALGVPQGELGDRLDASLDVLEAAWGPDPVAHEGPDGRVPPSVVGPKPVQHPRPPVLLAGGTTTGLVRVAQRADGWNPVGLPIDVLGPCWQTVRDTAARYGRDPDALELVPRAVVDLTDRPVAGERAAYTGSLSQVVDDIVATRQAGAHEIILGLPGDPCFDQVMETYAAIAEAVDLPAAVPDRRPA
jgi:probable F420-dependent oxidoreductase